ncbi:hypothetical protein C8Q80DRAFT_1115736 [Daedaleopsis nitida]|nr:hypothetical protein C8Q80DRAFT_1115736 [Daedaleopsis nitida]
MFALPTALLVLSALASHANPLPNPAPAANVSAHLEPAASSAGPHSESAHSPNPASSQSPIPTLFLCSAANCASGCLEIVLTNVGSGNCFHTLPFTSVELIDPGNVYPQGFVDVAPANCVGWLQIPTQGVCYNIQGGRRSPKFLVRTGGVGLEGVRGTSITRRGGRRGLGKCVVRETMIFGMWQ